MTLHAQGKSIRAVATATGLARATVQKFVHAGSFPERQPKMLRPTQLTPFLAYLRERWTSGCHNAVQLWRELRERGFRGGRAAVSRLLQTWRTTPARSAPRAQPGPRTCPLPPPVAYSPRTTCWLLLKDCDKLSPAEQAYLTQLYHLLPAGSPGPGADSRIPGPHPGAGRRRALQLAPWCAPDRHTGVHQRGQRDLARPAGGRGGADSPRKPGPGRRAGESSKAHQALRLRPFRLRSASYSRPARHVADSSRAPKVPESHSYSGTRSSRVGGRPQQPGHRGLPGRQSAQQPGRQDTARRD